MQYILQRDTHQCNERERPNYNLYHLRTSHNYPDRPGASKSLK
jgi:hypothetical protein